jgi:hypothetical protein
MTKISKNLEESKVQVFDRLENNKSNTGDELFSHMETIPSLQVMFTCALCY